MNLRLVVLMLALLVSCRSGPALEVDRIVFENIDRGAETVGVLADSASERCIQLAELLRDAGDAESLAGKEGEELVGLVTADGFELSTVVPSEDLGRARMIKASLDRQLLRRQNLEMATIRLMDAEDGNLTEYDPNLFFSIEQLIAVDGSFNTTAIPGLGVNWRLFEHSKKLAAQIVVGGALNPGGGPDDVSAAIGAGFSYPVTEGGSVTLGYIYWDSNGKTDSGVYFGFVLGSFGKKVN